MRTLLSNSKFSKWIPYFLIALLICVSSYLSLVRLGDLPDGINQDEAVNGYDAYALFLTGKDHHGNPWPIMFQSFDDWVSPLLTYITIPSVALFGLSAWSVRLPVAILSVLSVVLLLLVIKSLKLSVWWQLFAGVTLSITGWQIVLARWAMPPSIVPFFSYLFLFCLFKFSELKRETSPKQKCITSLGVTLSAVLLTYTYQPLKLFVPVTLFLVLLLFFWLRPYLRWTVLTIFGAYLLAIFPLLWPTIAQPEIYNARLMSQRPFEKEGALKSFLLNYLSYFSPAFLFSEKTLAQLPQLRLFPKLMALPLVIGLLSCVKSFFTMVRKREVTPLSFKLSTLLIWIAVAPIPASLMINPAYLSRSTHLPPILIIVATLGVRQIFLFLNERFGATLAKAVLFFTCAVIALFHFQFLNSYFTHYQSQFSWHYHFGFRQALSQIEATKDCKTILIDTMSAQPYMLYLFYSQLPPNQELYSAVKQKAASPFGPTVQQIGRVSFREVNPERSPELKHLVNIVGTDVPYRVYKSPSGACYLDR